MYTDTMTISRRCDLSIQSNSSGEIKIKIRVYDTGKAIIMMMVGLLLRSMCFWCILTVSHNKGDDNYRQIPTKRALGESHHYYYSIFTSFVSDQLSRTGAAENGIFAFFLLSLLLLLLKTTEETTWRKYHNFQAIR